MKTQFRQILGQLFRLINRLPPIGKLLFILLLLAAFREASHKIAKIFGELANFVLHNKNQILLALAAFGVLLLAAGCFLYFKRRKSQSIPEDKDLDNLNIVEETSTNNFHSIYTEGNFIAGNSNQTIYGNSVVIHGNQINYNADLSQILEKISKIEEMLRMKGYTQEAAQEEIANKLYEESLKNPALQEKIYDWRETLTNKNNPVNAREAAQDVVKRATSYNYSSSKHFTDVVDGDFDTLNQLLQSQSWEEADWETKRIIYEVGKKHLSAARSHKSGDFIPVGNEIPSTRIVEGYVKTIPEEYLNNIDKLWHNHSNGRFGFRVQKRIWEKVVKPHKGEYEGLFYLSFMEPFYSQAIEKFADQVGWRRNNSWLYYRDLYKPLKKAAHGHLPLAYMLLSDRVEKCSVNFELFTIICERL